MPEMLRKLVMCAAKDPQTNRNLFLGNGGIVLCCIVLIFYLKTDSVIIWIQYYLGTFFLERWRISKSINVLKYSLEHMSKYY